VDTPTKIVVANSLATYGAAPLPVVRRLARDCVEVAEPVIRGSQRLSPAELRLIAEELGPQHARLILAAHEAKQPGKAVPSPATVHNGTGVSLSTASRSNVRKEADASQSTSKAGTAAELCELFFSASAPERRLILFNLQYGAPDVLAGAAPLDGREACRRLEEAALQRKRGEFAQRLAQSLRLSAALARRITEDNSGEPMVVAAKALGMP